MKYGYRKYGFEARRHFARERFSLGLQISRRRGGIQREKEPLAERQFKCIRSFCQTNEMETPSNSICLLMFFLKTLSLARFSSLNFCSHVFPLPLKQSRSTILYCVLIFMTIFDAYYVLILYCEINTSFTVILKFLNPKLFESHIA